MGSNAWDEYNAPSLTRDDVVRGPVKLPFIAVQTTPRTAYRKAVSAIDSLKVDIRDQVDGRTGEDDLAGMC